MGDRGNIYFMEPDYKDPEAEPANGIYFYTHWRGSELPQIVASGLDRGRGRWSDNSYLARILFNELTKGDEMSETGFGISLSMPDNEHLIVVVDDQNQKVWFAPEGREKYRSHTSTKYSYEEFIEKHLRT